MNKYKVKSKYDNERFQKDNEEYLLKLSRPLKPESIRALNKEKMNNFIEDVLKNKKMNLILYESIANKVIDSSLKSIKSLEKQNNKYIKSSKDKIEPVSFVKRKNRKEAYVQMRTEIKNYEKKKKIYVKDLLSENYKKYLRMKKQIYSPKNETIENMRVNRINSFKRAYENLKLKLDDNKGLTIETEYSSTRSPKNKTLENYYLFRNNYIDVTHNINLPTITCDINDVYSRLYNNKVLLPSQTQKFMKINKKYKVKRPISLIRNKRHIKNKNDLLYNKNTLQPNPKIILNLKNVLKSNGGKEFITKVTDKTFKKCFDKYSGGPEVIKYLNEQIGKNNKDNNYINNNDIEGMVNFNELTENNTGNTFLHLATMGNYSELVKYFIEKGADINKKNKEGNTPLHLALKNKNMEIIKIFLDNKAKLNIPNNEGEIPFDYFTKDMKKFFNLETTLVINPIKGK